MEGESWKVRRWSSTRRIDSRWRQCNQSTRIRPTSSRKSKELRRQNRISVCICVYVRARHLCRDFRRRRSYVRSRKLCMRYIYFDMLFWWLLYLYSEAKTLNFFSDISSKSVLWKFKNFNYIGFIYYIIINHRSRFLNSLNILSDFKIHFANR